MKIEWMKKCLNLRIKVLQKVVHMTSERVGILHLKATQQMKIAI